MKKVYIIAIVVVFVIVCIDLIDSWKKFDKIITESLNRKHSIEYQNSNEKSSKVYLKSLFK